MQNLKWQLRTPIVYRYMEERYVNDFFETGSLRLSSFAKFISSNHAERFDDKEGETCLIAKTKANGGQTFSCFFNCGQNAYVLCGSTQYNADLENAFDKSCIQINNTVGFAQEIAKCIPDFLSGFEGLCMYQNQKIIEKDIGFISPEIIMDKENPNILNEKVIREILFQIGGVDVYFLKPIRYIKQSEYRFIWQTKNKIDDAFIIKCPEAIKYCQRPSNWNRSDLKLDATAKILINTKTDSLISDKKSGDPISFPESWKRRHAIGFPPADSELENFSIRLTRGAFNDEIFEPNGPFSCQKDGGDIRFSLDKNGKIQLAADIIKFEHDNTFGSKDAEVDIRVKVPVVPSTHCLTIFVWYLVEKHISIPEPNSKFGRLNAYDESWKSYHPSKEGNRLHD